MEAGENTYYMIDKTTKKLWGMYDGRLNKRVVYPDPTLIPSTGDMAAVSAWTWDLTTYDLRPDGHPSNSMSGTCPPAGAIRKDEWDAGVINHALFAAAYRVSADWVYPARASGSGISNPSGQNSYPEWNTVQIKSIVRYQFVFNRPRRENDSNLPEEIRVLHSRKWMATGNSVFK